jgi:class 3 adenylate cyclase/pimeloyl-ACP methyl ester carboxylesterase
LSAGAAQPNGGLSMARTQTVTILFCDLVGSTERRARLGDDAADEFKDRFFAALRRAVTRDDGTEVKSLGDGLMAAFPASAADAVTCATEMHRAMAELDPDDPPQLRIGISSGEVAQDGTDWSGLPVVEAARLEAAAAPGQTLASAVVRSLVGTRRALRFRDVGTLTLKGLPAPLATVEVVDAEIADLPATQRSLSRKGRHGATRPVIAGTGALVVALVAAGLVAITSKGGDGTGAGIAAPKGYTPRYEAKACPADVRTLTPDATCGNLVVPEDRNKPHGKTIRIAVLRAPARTQGGNAAPTIDVGGHDSLASSPVRDHAELIQLVNRGFASIGDPKLTCPEVAKVLSAALSRPSDDPATLTQSTDAVARCYARLVAAGINPGAYTLEAEVHDVLDLMVALKVSRADLLSGSAETSVVFGVLQQAPGAVRSVTVENPFPPGAGFLTDPVGDLANALNAYVALCAADPTCSHAYPNLRAAFSAAYRHYTANPTLVSATNATDPSAAPIPLLLDGHRSIDALTNAFTSSLSFPLIPAAIAPTPVDNVIAAQARANDTPEIDPNWPFGANLSYICSYFVHTVDTGSSTLSARTYPELIGDQLPWPQWCAQWKVPDVSGPLSAEVATPVPILMMRGGVTPYGNPDWIRRLQRSLPHSTVAEFPTLGEDLLVNGPPCLSGLRRQFLANPQANLDVNRCVRQSPPIKFVAPQ